MYRCGFHKYFRDCSALKPPLQNFFWNTWIWDTWDLNEHFFFEQIKKNVLLYTYFIPDRKLSAIRKLLIIFWPFLTHTKEGGFVYEGNQKWGEVLTEKKNPVLGHSHGTLLARQNFFCSNIKECEVIAKSDVIFGIFSCVCILIWPFVKLLQIHITKTVAFDLNWAVLWEHGFQLFIATAIWPTESIWILVLHRGWLQNCLEKVSHMFQSLTGNWN